MCRRPQTFPVALNCFDEFTSVHSIEHKKLLGRLCLPLALTSRYVFRVVPRRNSKRVFNGKDIISFYSRSWRCRGVILTQLGFYDITTPP